MIPACLKLTEIQIEKLNKFKNFVKEEINKCSDYDEDCTPTSPISFEIRATGIGDVIVARFKSKGGRFSNIEVD